MLNERLTEINKNIKDYITYNTIPTCMTFGAFDIEACYIKSGLPGERQGSPSLYLSDPKSERGFASTASLTFSLTICV